MYYEQVIGRNDELDDAFKHLTSRNPQQFWTSGQWMTERKGGSDVGLYLSFLLLLYCYIYF